MRLNETNDFDFLILIRFNLQNIKLISSTSSLQRGQEYQYGSKHHIPQDHLIFYYR